MAKNRTAQRRGNENSSMASVKVMKASPVPEALWEKDQDSVLARHRLDSHRLIMEKNDPKLGLRLISFPVS